MDRNQMITILKRIYTFNVIIGTIAEYRSTYSHNTIFQHVEHCRSYYYNIYGFIFIVTVNNTVR